MPPSDGNTALARSIFNEGLAKRRYLAICNNIIPKLAAIIIKNPNLFEITLLDATVRYQNAIKGKFLRAAGLKRAEKFIQDLSMAKDFNAVLTAFDEVIQKGNENSDSLKTYIIISIINGYFDVKKQSFLDNTTAIRNNLSYFLKTLANELIVAAQPEMQFVRRGPGGPLELVEEKTVSSSVKHVM